MNFTLVKRLPLVTEFNLLRSSVDWPVFAEQNVARALKNSLFGVVVVEDNGNAVAMGRVLGDEVIYFHIQDVIVHPSCQGYGLGKIVVDALMEYINAHAVSNTNVGLMSSKGREAFYTKFGFTSRPNEKFGAGMIMIR